MASINYPKTREERIRIYLQIIEEIKLRLQTIQVVQNSQLRSWVAYEICILQLRHICELIAVGCLTVQGKLTVSSSLMSEDNPVKIFKALDRLVENAFPQPAIITHSPSGSHINANSKPNAITRKELESVWSKSGHDLHRLTVKKFLNSELMATTPAWDYVRLQVSKIVDLLDVHLMGVPASAEHPVCIWLVSLHGANGNAEASLMDMNFDAREIELTTRSVEFSPRNQR